MPFPKLHSLLFQALLLSSVATLLTLQDFCNRRLVRDEFVPKVPHQVLGKSYVDAFEEIFVIGDVHGCYDELKLLLKQANASSHRTLKILVGDLMKKGPRSLDVLNYVRNSPSVLSVRGNKDQEVLSDWFSSGTVRNSDFVRDLSLGDVKFLMELPYTISIPSLNMIVVHAGVSPGVPLEENSPCDMMTMRSVVPDRNCSGGYRPTALVDQGFPWASIWQGPQHVVYGHDAGRSFSLNGFATGIDTGCASGRYLTGLFVKGPRAWQTVHQKALKQYTSSKPVYSEECLDYQ